MSVKFADKPCSERMVIVQSCQVQMIKNLEVVGAFSAKNFFPEKIIFDDLPQPPPPPSPKNFGQCTILGVQKFFGHTKIFRDIIQIFQISQNNTISHKIDRICPIFLYYKPILPDCEANIAYRFVVYYFSFADKSLHLPTTCFQGGCHTPHTPHSRRPCSLLSLP